MSRKYAIIVNPVAGRGRTSKRLPLLKSITDEADAVFDYYVTSGPGDATLIADRVVHRYDAVVAYGGDGTANEVMNGLIGSSIPFGIIPDGTGNDFARSLNVSRNLKHAIQVLLDYKVRSIDLGVIGDRVFLNGVGVGFDGYVNYNSRKVTKLKGTIAYVYAIVLSLLTWRSIPVTVKIDGKDIYDLKAFLIAIGNGWSIAGGLKLTPTAIIDDSIFDICQIDNISMHKALYNLMRLVKGTHENIKEVSMRRARNVVINSKYPLPVHFDGEFLGFSSDEIRVSVVPNSAYVIGGWS